MISLAGSLALWLLGIPLAVLHVDAYEKEESVEIGAVGVGIIAMFWPLLGFVVFCGLVYGGFEKLIKR